MRWSCSARSPSGLASGVGLYALAVFSTAFLIVALGIIESFEKGVKKFELTIKAGNQTDELRPKIEAILRRFKLPYELRASADEELCYEVAVPFDLERDRVTDAILRLDPEGPRGRRLVGKEEQGEVTTVKLIIQPDEGLTTARSGRQEREAIDRHRDLPLRPSRAREGARRGGGSRGVAVRALIAHTNRGGEKNLRKLEMRLLAAGVIVARTADDLTRYHSKMMIVDDTLYVLGFNLHAARYRAKPELRRRHVATSAWSRRPRRSSPPTVRRQPYKPGHDRFVVSPESSRRAADGLYLSRRKKAAAHLRRQDLGSDDDPRARGAAEGRRRDPHHRQGGEGAGRRRDAQARRPAAARSRDRPRRHDGLRRQPEPAQAGAGRPARSRRHRQRPPDGEEDSVCLRGRLD